MRLLAVGLTAVLLLLTVRTTFMLNYINYDMATEFLVYAHAGPDVKRALAEIDLISQRTVGDRNIVVAYDNESSWPLSRYMREYPNAKMSRRRRPPTPWPRRLLSLRRRTAARSSRMWRETTSSAPTG